VLDHENEFQFDVFVSYSSKDKEWVRGELVKRIEEAGLRAFIDFRDFEPGAASITEMTRGVQTCRKTLLVLSENYIKSEWCELEQIMLQVLSPANRELRFIPLLRERCSKPLTIAGFNHIDFTDEGDEILAWTQLLTALGAPPIQVAPEAPTRADWCLKHPYPMPPNFTGRADEREMLSEWLASDERHPLFVLRALGGFGKSALVWHWLLHDVDVERWPRVVWWGFYDDRNFETFLRGTLEYSGVEPRDLSPRAQADELLDMLHESGTLLVLDGFERALRAYGSMNAAYQGDADVACGETDDSRGTDCISPIAEHFLRSVACLPEVRSRVLMTTRLRPRILESHSSDLLAGCREVELTQMQSSDAIAFFLAQGIRGIRAEIQAACEPYGYHPLSLRLVVGLVANDPQQPGDIAAAQHLDVAEDLKARQHHVLRTAYENLDQEEQGLLSMIACFRGAVSYEALGAIVSGIGDLASLDLDGALRGLVNRGLLHHDRKQGKYDLHPIVRRYAYDRLSGEARTDTHGQLRDYFAAVPEPDQIASLDDMAVVIELYYHTVRAGQYDEANDLLQDRLVPTPLYFQFGASRLCIELLSPLFPKGESQPPRVETRRAQSWVANALANSYSISGQPGRAASLFQLAVDLDESEGDKVNLAVDLDNLAIMAQLPVGALRAAEASNRRGLGLARETGIKRLEAVARGGRGWLLSYCGDWAKSEEELAEALAIIEGLGEPQVQGVIWGFRAHRALLLARWTTLQGETGALDLQSAVDAATYALELADEDARTSAPTERDYVRDHWLLGAAQLAAGDLQVGEGHLNEALTRCRSVDAVDIEADILLSLARLRRVRGNDKEALRFADEALLITERCEYVLQSADIRLFLAEMALESEDEETALVHAREARKLATCDGPPDYTYKVACEEAGALLKKLGVDPDVEISG